MGTIWCFCLSISGLMGFWVSSCQVLSLAFFVCRFRALRDSGASAVGYCIYFCFSISGLEEFWGSRSRVLTASSSSLEGFWGSDCWASRDSGAPAVGYCLVFSSVNFGPLGILGLQLLFVTFGPRRILGLQRRALSVFLVRRY